MHRAILLVTATSDLAADLLVVAARERRLPLLRFNQDEFPERSQIEWHDSGEIRFRVEGRSFEVPDIAGAWFRRMPTAPVHQDHAAAFAAREAAAFLGGIWESVDWFWMNRPCSVTRAEYKLLQLREAKRLGFVVPPTLATNAPQAARDMVGARNAIAKTLAGGRIVAGGADHAVFTTAIRIEDLVDDEVQVCPLILQSRIPTEFDLRVTVVGDRTFPARIVVRDRTVQDVDWRRADPSRVCYENDTLPAEFSARCVELVSRLHLSYGAVDFVVTPAGEHVFLELNPSGQWGWIEHALGLPITESILDVLRDGVR
ncbi:MAG TPA: hypothetical protein VMU81_31600 [Acetobacteraceae bacterium]|nr:hypothetical protein [Acetobacteraceae bacterium]